MASSLSHRTMESIFDITELLEMILLRLDLTTLLVSAPRVSKSWQGVINTSPAIQQALYFRPAPGKSLQGSICDIECLELPHWDSEPSEGDETWSILNPLLVKKFGPCFFDFGDTYGFSRRASSFYKLPWVGKTTEEAENAWEPVDMDARMVRDEAAARRRFTRRGASWRRMLVSQPPPPKLGYLWMDLGHDLEESNTVWTALLTPQSPESFVGLRMGELYDLVQYHAGHHSRHSLWFRVLWGHPRNPFCAKFVQENRQTLLSKTHAVVELYHYDDTAWARHPRVPANVDIFDTIFRCDEYSRVAVQAASGTPAYGLWEYGSMHTTETIREAGRRPVSP